MKNIKPIKILYVVILATIILLNFYYSCNAAVIVDPNYSIIEVTPPSEVVTTAGKVLSMAKVVGTIAAVVVVAIVGIQYMIRSPEGKAEYKKTAYIYIVGAILLFAGPQIVQVIYNLVHK